MSATKTKPAKPTNTNGEDKTMSETALASPEFAALVMPIKITTELDKEGITVDLPNRYAALVGQPMSEENARIIFTHNAGQFRNNQVANAKARETRYGKDAKAEDAPWPADKYVRRWNGEGEFADLGPYSPTVGASERQSQSDKNRTEAAKRVWFELVKEHNTAIKSGGAPILKSTIHVDLDLRPVKTKSISTAEHEKAVEAWQERQDGLYGALLKSPVYADRINAMLEQITAEQGKRKADGQASGQVASADLI